MNSHTSHRPSAAEGLQTYGLAGVSLQRQAERLAAGTTGDANPRPVAPHRLRQAAGDLFIRLGTNLAGDVARPFPARAIQPKVDMA